MDVLYRSVGLRHGTRVRSQLRRSRSLPSTHTRARSDIYFSRTEDEQSREHTAALQVQRLQGSFWALSRPPATADLAACTYCTIQAKAIADDSDRCRVNVEPSWISWDHFGVCAALFLSAADVSIPFANHWVWVVRLCVIWRLWFCLLQYRAGQGLRLAPWRPRFASQIGRICWPEVAHLCACWKNLLAYPTPKHAPRSGPSSYERRCRHVRVA
jgi:hypothetical protein